MKVGYKKLGLVLGAVVALALLPARADAQFVRYSPVFWSFEGSAGIALPMGDLNDVADSGASFQGAVAYFLNPSFALRAEGGLNILGDDLVGIGGEDPAFRIWTVMGGFEYHITDPTSNGTVAIDFGAGLGIFDTDFYSISSGGGGSTTQAFNQSYFAANGGLKLGYNFARHSQTNTPIVSLFIQGDVDVIFADDQDTAVLASASGQSGFGTTILVPIRAGLRFNIP